MGNIPRSQFIPLAALLLVTATMVVVTPWHGQVSARTRARATAAADVTRFVIWSPKGLPSSAKKHLENVKGVKAATPVILGLDWIKRSWMPDGTKVDRLPRGYAYPVEIAVVRPGEFSHFVGAEQRPALDSLGLGETLISASGSRLRGEGEGLRLGLRAAGKTTVAGVIPDTAAHGYESLMASPPPKEWSYSVRFFLVRAAPDVSRKAMRRAIRDAAGDIPFDIRSGSQVKHLRYAPEIKPQATFKLRFGEFPAQPTTSGSFHLLSKWVSRHIRTDAVPILGNVTCHRKLFPQMRGALQELRDEGLAHLIRSDEYAGCYNSRFVATPPGTRLSRHSWGIAFDINTSNNQFGAEPHQDERLVKIMKKWGFIWGGRWPLPDGMHFEWTRFPD